MSNPNRAVDLAHSSPEELIESIHDKERKIEAIMENIPHWCSNLHETVQRRSSQRARTEGALSAIG
ncbi:MAG: hypothetical protein IPK17_35725 [Chloroflexi bacterium]|uniref:hypothetical protein n=1 Tax=Candidatus Flexifilum breve TaxID=3140694 RepID=UPI003134ADB1|nr:hypothetical protein [Chloroflexota bacterium]